jgi:hypothetical protein
MKNMDTCKIRRNNRRLAEGCWLGNSPMVKLTKEKWCIAVYERANYFFGKTVYENSCEVVPEMVVSPLLMWSVH